MHLKYTPLWWLSVSLNTVYENCLWRFLNASTDLHRTKGFSVKVCDDYNILYWITFNALSKVLNSRTVFYLILFYFVKKYTSELNTLFCFMIYESYLKSFIMCQPDSDRNIKWLHIKLSDIILCILLIINIYHISGHLINMT